MSTQNELPPIEQPLGVYSPVESGLTVSRPPTEVNPNNPPWGMLAGFLTLLGTVALLYVMPLLFVGPYAFPYLAALKERLEPLSMIPGMSAAIEETVKREFEHFLTTDKTAVLLQILSTIPAHLLTLALVWAVVTHFGKRPFWKTLGWSWSKNFGFWKTAGLAVALCVVSLLIINLVKGQPTTIDQIVNNSTASRYTLALIAGLSAPFVEETVFRGVLYSALQKSIGMVWAVAIVTFLFAALHVLQYYKNIAVIIGVTVLSLSLTLLRAYTGRLLPCFIVHFIFNGIQAIIILVEPYIHSSNVEQKAPALLMLARSAGHFF